MKQLQDESAAEGVDGKTRDQLVETIATLEERNRDLQAQLNRMKKKGVEPMRSSRMAGGARARREFQPTRSGGGATSAAAATKVRKKKKKPATPVGE